MITRAEIATLATHFGVPEPQIVRDHLISHVLAAIARLPRSAAGAVTFFGGTALCRTWLPDLRLSEDIDLLVETPAIAHELTGLLTRVLRREFPNLYDLAALAEAGHIDRLAVNLVKTIAGFTPSAATFGTGLPPMVETAWTLELGHQMSVTRSAAGCHAIVRLALAQLDGPS